MMRDNTQRAQVVVRWFRRLAWLSLAQLTLSTIAVAVTALIAAWGPESWAAWRGQTLLMAVLSMSHYVAVLMTLAFITLLLFGLERFIRYLLAYRAELLAKKERAHA